MSYVLEESLCNCRLGGYARKMEWRRYKRKKCNRLKYSDFTIISSNCVGMFMYYDMGLRYLSPTINLSIEMNDFVKMAENLKWYMSQKITELPREGYSCPVGLLDDIKIYFTHYDTFENGVQKWEERKQRVNWDKLFIVGSEKDGCTYDTIKRFDKLPYKNKVIFTHVNYPEFNSAFYIRGFENEKELGTITNFKNQFLKRRYLDDFDYVSFLNKLGRKGNKI